MDRPVIAIVSPGSFVIPSAESSSVELVIEQVARRLKQEARPLIFGKAAKGRPLKEIIDGVKYVRVGAPSPRAYIRNVGRKLAAYRPHVIQIENRPRYIRYLRRRFPRARLWLVLHSLTFVSKPHIGYVELRACLAAANRIIVNSEFLKEQLIRSFPKLHRKVLVNHLGVDTDHFVTRWSEEGERERERMLERMGLTGKKIIMYVGRLIEMKGVHHLLQAMPQIVRQVPEAVLLIIGSAHYGSNKVTPYVQELYRQADGLRQHVRFIPFVPHDEISSWYRLADILAVPSNETEAFGLVNVEAMACGVPVVATRSGGMKEIIEHGSTGYLIDIPLLGKELPLWISALLTDQERLRRMGEASIARVHDRFTWEHTARRWMDWYQSASKKTKMN
ncbi:MULTISPECIES: glycosyltransferase family 4 protein [unclassified Paenibacillus]|uniref:glycosyltransferase family 4 protein n=1 Tax=unclassified Paenibacillus TaxID=185978 RepID=UPI0009AE4B58|nr:MULTISPECIES: glycosyltransferase family 4 protein [unclassified Paenibacillus]MBE1445103.1 spore coat protein SA [Paenibacillus sp. OAS669]